MAKFKVVVTDYIQKTLKYEKELLNEIGAELVVAKGSTEEELIEVCKDADGILNTYSALTPKVINALEKCKVIARYGIGVNTIDLQMATKKGICVANVPDYCVDEVSDTALGLILACARKLVLLHNSIKSGAWDYKVSKPIRRLRGLTLGLVGYGKIARALAEKVKPLGLKILVYYPRVSETEAANSDVNFVGLEELLANSDFVSIHTPLNSETYHLIGERELSLMKTEAFLINTSRGSVIDENALILVLQQGQIAGAGLDVLEEEPTPKDNPLLVMDNVIINPHAAWYSEEAEIEMQRKAVSGVVEVLQGFYPRNLVNLEVKTKVSLKEFVE